MHNTYIALSTSAVLTMLIYLLRQIGQIRAEQRQIRDTQRRQMEISSRGVHALEDLTRPSGPQKVHARR